jgi:hypothetical protein
MLQVIPSLITSNFKSKAKTKETMKLQYDVIDHMPRVPGQFVLEAVKASYSVISNA